MGAFIAKLCKNHKALIREGGQLVNEVTDVVDAVKDKDVGDIIKNVGEVVNEVEDIAGVLKETKTNVLETVQEEVSNVQETVQEEVQDTKK